MSSKTYYIYLYQNTINNKIYIGKTCNITKRTEQVIEIINKYSTGNFTYKVLAKEYNMSPQQLNRIILGKRWRHLQIK